MFHWLTEHLHELFHLMGFSTGFSKFFTGLIIVAGMVLLWFILAYLLDKCVSLFVRMINKRKPTVWRVELLDKKFYRYISYLVSLFIVQALIPQFFYQTGKIATLLGYFVSIAITINITLVISAFLSTLTDILLQKEGTKDKPIKSYMQIVKIIFWAIAVILIISIILGKSPAGLLAGIGAFSAVLLLVFQDTIIGFVNSIQLASNDLLRNGDWITMNKFGADGTVEEINLTSVKVRNFDNTIVTIPVKQLIADSFQNWRGMEEKGIRRIKRSIRLDINTIRPCTKEMLEKFKEISGIRDYVENLEKEIEKYNEQFDEQFDADTSLVPNGRHQTNVGVLRAYILAYLKNNPKISKKGTLMVRQLEPNEYGLPLEIYCFAATSIWADYENIQSDLFDHIYSVLSFFDIKAFQRK